MDGLLARVARLERQRAALEELWAATERDRATAEGQRAAMEQDRALAERRLRRWRGVSVLAIAAAFCLLPLGANGDPGGVSSLAEKVAVLEQKVVTLQTGLSNELTARQAGDAALQGQVMPLATKLERVSIQQIDGYYSLVIDGANLHLRNGLGATNGNPADPIAGTPVTNGLGNLILGYNESRVAHGETDFRQGSHNLIAGDLNNYSSYGGIVVGFENAIYAPYASVSGGQRNTASHLHASVSGGEGNLAAGPSASVSGGLQNTANHFHDSISGGQENLAAGGASSVSGGFHNWAVGQRTSVSGGANRVRQNPDSWQGGALFAGP